MKFLKVARRVTLLIVVNLLVMLTLVAIASLFFHGRAMQFGYGNLLGWCLIIGMGGVRTGRVDLCARTATQRICRG